jgi:hypothetical protein
MNSGRFPSSGGSSGNISYEEGAGLRQRDVYAEADGQPYIYRDWKTEIARKCRPTAYDEERRLLYVALSRAQRHILCTAGGRPNTFLEELPVSLEPGVVDIPSFETEAEDRPVFEMPMPEPRGPRSSTPHELGATAEAAAGPAESAGGMSFGDRVHEFAEAYALGDPVAPANDHEEAVASFLDGLSGELRPEEHVHLPLEAEGQQVTLSGIIDLLQITDEAVAIVDYKTDATPIGPVRRAIAASSALTIMRSPSCFPTERPASRYSGRAAASRRRSSHSPGRRWPALHSASRSGRPLLAGQG